ncbi:PP0621 family protein [Herbaspirillum lusitanum]|uniref:PP0621 family protein n=1 Tax=Herbaspirillum lusitanum TaxID=213312 RepID=UPI0002FD7BE5|nr:PP0621 family protein [Herbaspirillum lusitanum]
MKYLIWLVIALAVVVWFQRTKKSMTAGAASSPDREGARRNPFARKRDEPRQQIEAMVQCAHCGIHFPVSEAVVHASGALYCSEEHRRLASF